jgi:hypothetical protein
MNAAELNKLIADFAPRTTELVIQQTIDIPPHPGGSHRGYGVTS